MLDDLPPEPSYGQVQKLVDACRAEGADMILAVGGGSVMDASKAIAVMAVNEGDLWDYIGGGTGKGLVPENTPLPIVAITTTAGTARRWINGALSRTRRRMRKSGSAASIPCSRCWPWSIRS